MEKKSKNFLLKKYYKNKKVLVTGANGFKGSWLSLILKNFGANVYGIGINKKEYLFSKIIKINKLINYQNLNINNEKKLKNYITKLKPDIIFHLASESLVGECNYDPKNAFNTNVLGLVNFLEVFKERKNNKKLIINIVTSDKCYSPQAKKEYHENDNLGGHDIYSASKSCQEIVTRSYYESFFKKNKKIILTTFRAGNVIGGGDYAPNRLFPDIARALNNKTRVKIRNPKSTRPWQHVFDCLNGYLNTTIYCDKNNIQFSNWNFSPSYKSMTVEKIIYLLISKKLINKDKVLLVKNFIKESLYLNLSNKKVIKLTNWKNKFNFNQTVIETINFYKEIENNKKNLSSLLNSIQNKIKNFFY